MAIEDGGQAFPQSYRIDGCSTIVGESGLSIRDYFAAKAMQSIIASCDQHEFVPSNEVSWWIGESTVAYRIADAMLAARKR